MRVFVFEDNLMWSARLAQTLRGTGHEPLVRTTWPESDEGAEAAIVNLGSGELRPSELVPRLQELGVRVIAHAGHREKELMELGRAAGADVLATNRELTYKLPQLLRDLRPTEGSATEHSSGEND